MTAPPVIAFHDYAGMVDAFRAIKDHLGLSNAALDALCNFTAGHSDKLLGPTRVRGFGPLTLDAMLWALAVKVTVSIDLDRANEMAAHWEHRVGYNVRAHGARVSKEIVERARPMVIAETARKANAARNAMLTGEHRSAIARKAAKVRWRRQRERLRIERECVAD